MYIFDADGTIIDSAKSIAYHLNKALNDFEIPEVSYKDVESFLGNGSTVLVKKALEKNKIKDDKLMEKVLEDYLKRYNDNPAYLTNAYDGIIEELSKIKERDKIIVFSNKPHDILNNLCDEVFGKDFFDMVLGQSGNYKRKPSPEGIYIIKEKFKAKSSDIIYFGDTEVDIDCAKRANVFSVACTWGFRDREYLSSFRPDIIIDNVEDISKIRRV